MPMTCAIHNHSKGYVGIFFFLNRTSCIFLRHGITKKCILPISFITQQLWCTMVCHCWCNYTSGHLLCLPWFSSQVGPPGLQIMCAQSHYYGPWKNGPIPWVQTCLRTCASFTHSFRSRSMAVAKMLGWLPITSSTSQPRLSPKLKGRCLILLPEQNALCWVLILGRSFTCICSVLITMNMKCSD